jgi:hypothetical protein
VTTIAAISPPGGDFSEPVTQAALRVTSALWALDPGLASQRHYPAVDWDVSFSLDAERVAPWFAEMAGARWLPARASLLKLLERERALRDVATLVGPEALEERDRLLLASRPQYANSSCETRWSQRRLVFTARHSRWQSRATMAAAGERRSRQVWRTRDRSRPDDARDRGAARCVGEAAPFVAAIGDASLARVGRRLMRARRTHMKGAAGTGDPLLFLNDTPGVALGEWVVVRLAGQPDRRGG